MNIVRPEIERTINWWAWRVSTSFPSLEREDVVQELWAHATVASKTWEEDKHASLLSYLYPKIKWGAFQLMRNQARRSKKEHKYAQFGNTDTSVPAQTRSVETVVSNLQTRFSKRKNYGDNTLRVFEVVTNPPRELFDQLDDRIDLTNEECHRTVEVKHIAHYLSIGISTVHSSLSKIKKALEAGIQREQEISSS